MSQVVLRWDYTLMYSPLPVIGCWLPTQNGFGYGWGKSSAKGTDSWSFSVNNLSKLTPANKRLERSAAFAHFPSILEKWGLSVWWGGRTSVQNWRMLSKRPHVWRVPAEVIFTGHVLSPVFEMTETYGVFFPLNVLLDFSVLGCETISAHSLSLPRRGCCLGLLIEQFLSCFFKSHH